MKKISYVLALAAAAYAFQGCHTGGTTDKTVDSISQSVDSTNAAKADQTQAKVDTTAAKTNAAATQTDTADAKFARTLAAGGTAEIRFSQLAQQKAKPGALDDFAAMMIRDHTQAADSLKAIAQRENITLPAGMDHAHQNKYDIMDKAQGYDFNQAYVMQMVADHKDAVNLLQNESQNGKDPVLKAFAAKILPTVQMHLKAAKKLVAQMK